MIYKKLKELLEKVEDDDICLNCDNSTFTGCLCGGCEPYENFKQLYELVVEIKNKIVNGTLIERYFIQEDEMPNGKIWYNVCELNENYGSIKNQCATRAEAEARLAELYGKKD